MFVFWCIRNNRESTVSEYELCLFVAHIVVQTCGSLCLSRRPCVTRMDRRTHARRRGLWERGVALRGCALFLSFSFFPPSRPSSAPVLQPSPPLIYRLQVFGLSYSYCDNSSHLRHCFTLLFPVRLGPFLCWLYCAYSFKTCLPSPIATPHYACYHFDPMLPQEKVF